MRPLTDDLPKPLLHAGGKSLIAWHLRRLARAGIHEVVINHAWLGDRIEAALGDGSAFGVRIRYSAEETALETAGGVARAMPLLQALEWPTASGAGPAGAPGTIGLVGPASPASRAEPPARGPQEADSPFLLISADTFCDFEYGRAHTIALQMAHARLTCWCVMVGNPEHHRGGDFHLAQGLLQPIPRPQLTYSGIGLFTARMFDDVPRGHKSPLRPWLEREIAAGRAAGEYHGGLWFDIGTAQRLAELNRLLDTGTISPGA